MREDAAAAARRIVEDVLARHGQGGQPPGEGSPEPSDHVAPADGAAASEEAAPGATLPADTGSEEVAEPETGTLREPADTELLGSADEATSDAARIARRIVAEALADAEHPPDLAPPPAAPDDAARADGPAGDEPAPAPAGAEEIVRRIVADVQADADDAAPAVVVGPEPTDETATDDAEPGDQDTAGVLRERSGPTTELPEREALAVGAPAGARVGDTTPADEPAPVAPLRRPLEGWAVPADPATPSAPQAGDAPPRTLRWLLASLLGAVALAVLFPLAVAALRALVTMD